MNTRGQPFPERQPAALPPQAGPHPMRGFVCRHCDTSTGTDTGECWARWRDRAVELEKQLAAKVAA